MQRRFSKYGRPVSSSIPNIGGQKNAEGSGYCLIDDSSQSLTEEDCSPPGKFAFMSNCDVEYHSLPTERVDVERTTEADGLTGSIGAKITDKENFKLNSVCISDKSDDVFCATNDSKEPTAISQQNLSVSGKNNKDISKGNSSSSDNELYPESLKEICASYLESHLETCSQVTLRGKGRATRERKNSAEENRNYQKFIALIGQDDTTALHKSRRKSTSVIFQGHSYTVGLNEGSSYPTLQRQDDDLLYDASSEGENKSIESLNNYGMIPIQSCNGTPKSSVSDDFGAVTLRRVHGKCVNDRTSSCESLRSQEMSVSFSGKNIAGRAPNNRSRKAFSTLCFYGTKREPGNLISCSEVKPRSFDKVSKNSTEKLYYREKHDSAKHISRKKVVTKKIRKTPPPKPPRMRAQTKILTNGSIGGARTSKLSMTAKETKSFYCRTLLEECSSADVLVKNCGGRHSLKEGHDVEPDTMDCSSSQEENYSLHGSVKERPKVPFALLNNITEEESTISGLCNQNTDDSSHIDNACAEATLHLKASDGSVQLTQKCSDVAQLDDEGKKSYVYCQFYKTSFWMSNVVGI